jgi:hypothetical protein
MLRSAILFFLLLLLPARANLGETVGQCVARYGQPVGYSEANPKFPFGTVAFSATGYTLIVFILETKEVGARVAKVDKSAFSDAELQTILNADSAAGSLPWSVAVSTDPTCLQWSRSDKATALYDKAKHIIVFTAQEMADALRRGIPVPRPSSASTPVTAPAPAPAPPPAPAH